MGILAVSVARNVPFEGAPDSYRDAGMYVSQPMNIGRSLVLSSLVLAVFTQITCQVKCQLIFFSFNVKSVERKIQLSHI